MKKDDPEVMELLKEWLDCQNRINEIQEILGPLFAEDEPPAPVSYWQEEPK